MSISTVPRRIALKNMVVFNCPGVSNAGIE
jgi:hypothetical protein